MWKTLWESIKEVLRKMIPSKTIEQTLQVDSVLSNEMSNALKLWDAMYKGEAAWLHEPSYADPTRVVSLGLPAFIASEKARMAVLEMKSEIRPPVKLVEKDNPEYIAPTTDENGIPQLPKGDKEITVEVAVENSARAELLNEVYQKKIIENLRIQLEYGIAKGGLVIKPYVIKKNVYNDRDEKTGEEYQLDVEFIQADAFYPLAFSSNGNITEAVFVQTKLDKKYVYYRLEWHILQENRVIIRNRAFRRDNVSNLDIYDGNLGTEVPLTEVPEWASLQKEQALRNVDKLLFAYFKMPEANTIDPNIPLGVSGYSRAVQLIKDADTQYSRMLWEFEATEAAIDIDRDALLDVTDRQGNYHSINPTLQQRLFRRIELGDDTTYFPYNPPIRDQSLINGLNNILMRIEDVCALSRGTLADVAEQARTATELKVLKQRTYQANKSIQAALEKTLKDTVDIMNIYASLYGITDDGEYEANFEWDDSMITDLDAELGKRLTLMQNQLASKLEIRMWYFGETEAQARAALQQVQDENRQQMQENILQQKAMGDLGLDSRDQEAQGNEME